jgi:Phosphotransferase enzyme family
VPTAGGDAFLKVCGAVQGFEPALTAAVASRSPSLLPEVIAADGVLLLMADAGLPVGISGNPPEVWLDILPRYAELQRIEASHADEHLALGVPDLRGPKLLEGYDHLLRQPLPLDLTEVQWLTRFAPTLAELAERLGLAPTVQHDDLHMNNVYVGDGRLRVLDWGDASVAHPYFSLFVTFRFLEEVAGLSPTDPWFCRLADAYLEVWPTSERGEFGDALVVAGFAHAVASLRQRDHLTDSLREGFDRTFAVVLRRAMSQAADENARSQWS